MSDFTQPAIRADSATSGLSRAREYARAVRHTRRVRFLRKTIIVASLATIAGIVGVSVFDPFGRLPRDFSAGSIRINGSRVTLELPKLSGYRQDGRPYNISAASGIQDIRNPNVVELSEIEARFETGNQATVRLTSPEGVYDTAKEMMHLQGDVHITSTTGFDVRMLSADMDFKAGTVVSHDTVNVVSNGGNITADSVNIVDSGKKISFQGHVRSSFQAAPSPPDRGAGK